jgi:hypothetical protein
MVTKIDDERLNVRIGGEAVPRAVAGDQGQGPALVLTSEQVW